MNDVAPWIWRNCRSIAFGCRIWLWPWAFGAHTSEDCYGGSRSLYVGPFEFTLTYSIGNVSADRWYERAFALCEADAWQHAVATLPPSESDNRTKVAG